MNRLYLFCITIFLGVLCPFSSLWAGGQQENINGNAEVFDIVGEILNPYDPDNLTKEDVLEIHAALKEQGLRGGPEIDDAVKAAGFNPETLKELGPPEARSDEERKNGPARDNVKNDQDGKQNYSVSQAVSDNAQLHTIAFNALAFFTGDASADTFFPPGKVSDFFGFQYFRDVDEGGMGHNTTFVPRVANNILATLNEEQIRQLVDLALAQEKLIKDYGYGRYPLMIAFRKNMEEQYPEGTNNLDRDAVADYSAQLYNIDGELSYRRAEVLGGIINSLSDNQRARFDEMASGDSESWGFPDDQVDKSTMSHAAHVLVMTYASEMFTWYAGDVESDTYFCPERHGTYYGGFYMKDAPVMDDPDFFIDINATGGSGSSLLKVLSPSQAKRITDLVDLQRKDLDDIVKIRRVISDQLRVFMDGDRVDENKFMSMMAEYGTIDGQINYRYASTFAEIYQELTDEQLKALALLRLSQGFEPEEGYLFAEPVAYPSDIEYEFLFQ